MIKILEYVNNSNKSVYYYKIIGSDNYLITKSSLDISLFSDKNYNYIVNKLMSYSDFNSQDILLLGKIKNIVNSNKEEYGNYIDYRYLNGFEDEDDKEKYVLYFLSQTDNKCYLAKSNLNKYGVTFNINDAKTFNRQTAINIYNNKLKNSSKEYEIFDIDKYEIVTKELIKN